MNNWIPVEERLPEIGEQVLTNCKHGIIEGRLEERPKNGATSVVFANYYWRDMEWYATHWMPLPEPPE